jgi:hypothetical protein
LKAALIVAILRMMEVRSPDRHPTHCHHFLRASQVTSIVVRQLEAEKSSLPGALISAVIGKESSWRWRKEGDTTYRKGAGVLTGERGERGYMQIKPDGRATIFCADILERALERPDENVACGIRLLEAAQAECGGEPGNWLGRYRGDPCGPSEYARNVLRILNLAEPVEVAVDVEVGR